MLFKSDRKFGLKEFTNSHHQVLIRSSKDHNVKNERNIDLHFTGVFYLQLPTGITGIEVSVASQGQLSNILDSIYRESVHNEYLFMITSQKQQYLIGASRLIVKENDYEYFQSGFDEAEPSNTQQIQFVFP